MSQPSQRQFSLRYVLSVVTACCVLAAIGRAWPEPALRFALLPSVVFPAFTIIAILTALSSDRFTCFFSGLVGMFVGVILIPAVLSGPSDPSWSAFYRSVFLYVSLPLAVGALAGCATSFLRRRRSTPPLSHSPPKG
jgi:hypothetical protein